MAACRRSRRAPTLADASGERADPRRCAAVSDGGRLVADADAYFAMRAAQGFNAPPGWPSAGRRGSARTPRPSTACRPFSLQKRPTESSTSARPTRRTLRAWTRAWPSGRRARASWLGSIRSRPEDSSDLAREWIFLGRRYRDATEHRMDERKRLLRATTPGVCTVAVLEVARGIRDAGPEATSRPWSSSPQARSSSSTTGVGRHPGDQQHQHLLRRPTRAALSGGLPTCRT